MERPARSFHRRCHIIMAAAVLLCLNACALKAQTLRPGPASALEHLGPAPRSARLSWAAGQGLAGKLGRFNLLAPKEPMVADPNRAYPRVQALPGGPFTPVSYSTDSLIAQLAHSSNGIVRLPPGDYSIRVRFY